MNHDIRRIGVLAPPANVAVEREWPRYLPDGVVMNHNRLSRTSTAVAKDELLAMNASVERAARDLAFAQPEVIVYACTSGSFLNGPDEAEALSRRIEALTGIPAVTTSQAVIAALHALRAKRVFMITPYADAVNAVEASFLAHFGVTVAGVDAFRCAQSSEIRALTSEQVAELARAHHGEIASCDSLFISCTNLLTMNEIDELEAALGVPVVSSNQASLWAALSQMKIAAPSAPGRLFRQAA
ncbi:aspartate/glutamate racemase family protein [Bradyrhizobium sp. Arg237L]|uniref:maleate cis-trans isomerase family protein n=1 Tax=Bradyrhizobium sp. Arg237L TaxID=3003352 RepID=UPI00249F3050|nr:aspartate/glutamate racemase family protein [Bradyrhizobium sp. Arg237L]MDI4232570.1 aspartate/glutamate racemase family protein [Bradyrhizobium sp. Arg237L]